MSNQTILFFKAFSSSLVAADKEHCETTISLKSCGLKGGHDRKFVGRIVHHKRLPQESGGGGAH